MSVEDGSVGGGVARWGSSGDFFGEDGGLEPEGPVAMKRALRAIKVLLEQLIARERRRDCMTVVGDVDVDKRDARRAKFIRNSNTFNRENVWT